MTCAAEGGHIDFVEFFIQKGANDWNGEWTMLQEEDTKILLISLLRKVHG
jgi:hypothetical protein